MMKLMKMGNLWGNNFESEKQIFRIHKNDSVKPLPAPQACKFLYLRRHTFVIWICTFSQIRWHLSPHLLSLARPVTSSDPESIKKNDWAAVLSLHIKWVSKYSVLNWVCSTLVIPVLGRLRVEESEFEDSLDCLERLPGKETEAKRG